MNKFFLASGNRLFQGHPTQLQECHLGLRAGASVEVQTASTEVLEDFSCRPRNAAGIRVGGGSLSEAQAYDYILARVPFFPVSCLLYRGV